MTAQSTVEASAPTTAAVRRIGTRTVVSSLWLFAILNYLYCDVLASHDPEYMNNLLKGETGGIEMNSTLLLAASVLMTIPMSSVLVSRIASHALARWWSIVAGVIMTLVQIGSLTVGTAPSSYYWYFSAIEVATTAAIVWIAARRWKNDA